MAAFLARERTLVQRSMQVGLSSDSHELRFERELVARVNPAAVGVGLSGPALQVFYALPAFTFEPFRTRGLITYPLRFRLVAWDSSGAVAALLDTILTITRFAPATGDLPILGRVEVPLAAGRYSYRMALQSGDRAGVTLPPDTLHVAGPPPLGAAGLALSDLLLGGTPTSMVWHPPLGDSVSVDPAAVFGRNSTMQLAAEVYGPSTGAKLRARAFVAPLGAPAGTPLKWRSFPGASGWKRFSPGVSPVPSVGRLRLDFPLKKLAPGRYLLELLVTDEHKQSARGRRVFEVRAVEP